MKITGMTAQGNRPYQEDRYRILTDSEGGTLLAVFDGHGGHETAELLANTLEMAWERALLSCDRPDVRAISLFSELHELTKEHQSGSTASIVYIPKGETIAHVAVLGDSPVWILDRQFDVNKSPEHNVRSNPKEREAAIGRGAFCDGNYIYDLYRDISTTRYSYEAPGLQMSRALGDRELSRILSRIPECYPVELGPHSTILIASDGVLDPAHIGSEEVTCIMNGMLLCGAPASKFVQYALDRKTGDNVTALVVDMGDTEETVVNSISAEVNNVLPFILPKAFVTNDIKAAA